MSEVSETEEVLRAVDQIVAAADAKFWVAVRVIREGTGRVGLAFMGSFPTKEAAQQCCESNANTSLHWEARGERDDQWETEWLALGGQREWRWYVAEQKVEAEC